MKSGLIVKSAGNHYVVEEDGTLERYLLRARGKFRLDKTFPLAGDRVEFADSSGGMIHAVLERKNRLIRPPVANVDRLVVAVSMAPPVTDRLMIDTLLTAALYNGIEPVVCLNKADRHPGDELISVYSRAGFQTTRVSAATGEGMETLLDRLGGGITVFAGASGVGKSSLVNRIDPTVGMETGEISEKIGRGKHTTRTVELFRQKRGGFIVDTPGFSSVDLPQMELYDKTVLPSCFPEFRPFLGTCRYDDCAHRGEEGCAVGAAVARGEIDSVRYSNYLAMYESVKHIKEWQIKKGKG